MRRLAVLLAALALLGPAAPALAAACPRTSVAALEDDVMCPVCGTSLALARESPLARRERAFIARLAARCASRGEIETALVAQFGPAVLADPPHRGFDLSALVVPLLALAAGAGVLAAAALRLLRRRRRRPPPTGPALGEEDARRLAAALERHGL